MGAVTYQKDLEEQVQNLSLHPILPTIKTLHLKMSYCKLAATAAMNMLSSVMNI